MAVLSVVIVACHYSQDIAQEQKNKRKKMCKRNENKNSMF
jgi:hypothetical protein